MIEEKCICGHQKVYHIESKDSHCAFCGELWLAPELVFHAFKLDNFKLIEDLAKERKLI